MTLAFFSIHAVASAQSNNSHGFVKSIVIEDDASQVSGLVLDAAIRPLLRRDIQSLRAASCSSSACHGGARPGVTDVDAGQGAEYPLWLENDPHARAKRTICGPKSRQILSALHILRDGQIIDRTGFANCLACHDSAPLLAEPPPDDVAGRADPLRRVATDPLRREGVGCAACHGPAELWIGSHHRADHCGSDTAGDGLVSLGDLLVRARVCASCHVGDVHRDMNHDMIAAGHPPLRYEFATYHARLPKHWRESSVDPSTYQAKLWLAGQVASLDASLSLLESRTAMRNAVSVWPELSEFECASCHHDQSLIDKPGSRDRSPHDGSAAYSDWHRVGIRMWLEGLAGSTMVGSVPRPRQPLLDDLDMIQTLMERSPSSSPADVQAMARQARQHLDDWIRCCAQFELEIVTSMRLNRVIAQQANAPWIASSWESAVQYYLAAIAGREDWPNGADGDTLDVADTVRRALAYPQGREINTTPLGRQPGRRIEQSRLAELLQNLGNALTDPAGPALE